VVKFIGRFINHIKTERRVLSAKKGADCFPPHHQLRFIFGVGIGFKAIRLVSNNRNYAIRFAGFHQFSQMDQTRFGHVIGNANTHMANARLVEITHHQRVKLTNSPVGTRPVDIHPHTQLLRVMRRCQRSISGKRRGSRQQHSNSNQWL